MFKISNSKEDSEYSILSNIRLIKIIAIILGFLIILGLIILFLGLAKNFNNIEKNSQNKKIFSEINQEMLNQFNFIQPSDAQLISTSLGKNNLILLRYLYKGNNVLVVLDTNSKNIKSIITLKKQAITW